MAARLENNNRNSNSNSRPRVEFRLKVLALWAILSDAEWYFLMIKTSASDPDEEMRKRIQFSPPGGSVSERTAVLLGYGDDEMRETLAKNAAREAHEEAFKAERGLQDGGLGVGVVLGGMYKRNGCTIPASGGIALSDLPSMLKIVHRLDLGAYVEVEHRSPGKRSENAYYAYGKDDKIIGDIARGAYAPPPGFTLGRVIVNLVTVCVQDCTPMCESAFLPSGGSADISDGVFVDGVDARDAVREGSALCTFANMLSPRLGEIASVHLLSRSMLLDALKEKNGGPVCPYTLWDPLRSSLGKRPVRQAIENFGL